MSMIKNNLLTILFVLGIAGTIIFSCGWFLLVSFTVFGVNRVIRLYEMFIEEFD